MSAVFHIVEQNGEIELVHLQRLEPLTIKAKKLCNQEENSSTSTSPGKCTCVMCQPILETNVSNTATETATVVKTKINVTKNYSKQNRINGGNARTSATEGIVLNSIHPVKNVAYDSKMLFKTEPELEIMDIDVDKQMYETSPTPAETDAFAVTDPLADTIKVEPAPSIDKRITDALETDSKYSTSALNTVSIYSTSKKTIKSKVFTKKISTLQTKEIKCNICGMVFPPNSQQPQALRTHFLLHKQSVKRTFNCAQCHVNFSHMDYLMIIQHEKFHAKRRLPITTSQSKSKNAIRSYAMTKKQLQRSVKSAKLQDIPNGGCEVENDAHRRGVDSDDDIQIVERKPELIVIDDNDDDEMKRKVRKR